MDKEKPDFIKGLALCRDFFNVCAKPILERHFKGLTYSAGLLGYGSDILGFDDSVSTDHMWGPRFYLFLREEDIHIKKKIMEAFCCELPPEYLGYSVNFSPPNPNDGGVRVPEAAKGERVSPLIFIYTIDEYLEMYLGKSSLNALTPRDWIGFSEHRLLALTKAELFVDMLDLRARLEPVVFYPREVQIFLLASCWEMISQEQAFVRRCADVGDSIGSALACGRISERLMRLVFLYNGCYAPYSKWFGTAFKKLQGIGELEELLQKSLLSTDAEQREDALVKAQWLVSRLHDESKTTNPVKAEIQNYFGRNIKVIYADKIANALYERLKGTPLETWPPIGAMSQVANFTALSDNPVWAENVRRLYDQM